MEEKNKKDLGVLENKSYDINYRSTKYKIKHGKPQTHQIDSPTNVISIQNKDYYSKIRFAINEDTNFIDLQPLQTLSIKGSFEKIILETYFLDVEVVVYEGVDINIPQQKTALNIRTSEYKLLGCRRNIVLGSIGSRLYKSEDGGRLWYLIYALDDPKNYFVRGHISRTGYVLFDMQGNIYYRDNETDKVEKSDMSSFGKVKPPLHHGIDSKGSIIVFAEYGVEEEEYRVFLSNNNGKKWYKVLGELSPSEIRHFHSVNYNIHNNRWYLTSGDINKQVRWWTSNDAKVWEEIQGVNCQRYRTLNIVPIGYDEIIWGSDAIGTISEICIAKLDNIVETTRRVYNLPHACWGIYGNSETLIAITGIEKQDEKDLKCSIYVSKDCGKTWSNELKCDLEDYYTNSGFRGIVGMNMDEEILISTKGIKGIESKAKDIFIKIN